MVDMQLSNNKLVDRGTIMVMNTLKISYEDAHKKLLKYGSVRSAIDNG
jgi:N-acetylmuramic acid 6-phosphate etherase